MPPLTSVPHQDAAHAPPAFGSPLVPEDAPDPMILSVPGGYYLFVTNGPRGNAPVWFTPDLQRFEFVGDALPSLPSWAAPGHTWAPDVVQTDGRFVLYFTARHATLDIQVIGAASSDHPAGPYTSAPEPLVTMPELGGAIDASGLVTHAGQRFLYWKNDGNAAGLPTHLFGAGVTADGLHLTGLPVVLLSAAERWERNLVEAPQVIEQGGTYHLIYSAAEFWNASYSLGHAVGPTPLGPFQRSTRRPLLASHGTIVGPGHSHAFQDADGRWRLAFHAWTSDHVGYPSGRREPYVAHLHLNDRAASVAGSPSGTGRLRARRARRAS